MGKFAKTSRKHLRKPTPYTPPPSMQDKKQHQQHQQQQQQPQPTEQPQPQQAQQKKTTKKRTKAARSKQPTSQVSKVFTDTDEFARPEPESTDDDVLPLSTPEQQLNNANANANNNKKKKPVHPRGVIYVGRLPYGFYEKALRGFFSQFGEITRLRVARSKKVRCRNLS